MSQSTFNELALSVARRQKRLLYWQDQLTGSDLAAEKVKDIKERLNTFALLLSKMASDASKQSGDEKQSGETETRLLALERELTGLFESRRLMTSKIGSSAIRD